MSGAGKKIKICSSVVFQNIFGRIPLRVKRRAQIAVADEVAYLGSGVGLDLSSYFPDFFFQGANFQFSVLPPVELRLTRTASNYVQLSWRADAGSYVLQTAPRLGVTMTNALPPAVLAGTNRVVFVPMDTTNRFFRLVW